MSRNGHLGESDVKIWIRKMKNANCTESLTIAVHQSWSNWQRRNWEHVENRNIPVVYKILSNISMQLWTLRRVHRLRIHGSRTTSSKCSIFLRSRREFRKHYKTIYLHFLALPLYKMFHFSLKWNEMTDLVVPKNECMDWNTSMECDVFFACEASLKSDNGKIILKFWTSKNEK